MKTNLLPVYAYVCLLKVVDISLLLFMQENPVYDKERERAQ
jgi:predicted nucleic acid-binding Zn ribbon protein